MENRWLWAIAVVIIIILIIWFLWAVGRKFIANINGSQSVPPVETDGNGGLTLQLNPSQTVASYHGDIKKIPYPSIISINVHKGSLGKNGPFLFNLEYSPVKSIYTEIKGDQEMSEKMIDSLMKHELYVLVRYNKGNEVEEIRGQLFGV